jgi:chromosome segregation ATPase
LLSKEEQRSFAARFRAAQKSPQLVGLQIQALDGLIAFLKQKRATARRIIEESLAEIAAIEKEQAAMHQFRLSPLATRIAANEARHAELTARSREANQHFEQIIGHTGAQVAATKHKIEAFKSRQLKQDLAFARNTHGPPAASSSATTTTQPVPLTKPWRAR